jgi:hypothetical protein
VSNLISYASFLRFYCCDPISRMAFDCTNRFTFTFSHRKMVKFRWSILQKYDRYMLILPITYVTICWRFTIANTWFVSKEILLVRFNFILLYDWQNIIIQFCTRWELLLVQLIQYSCEHNDIILWSIANQMNVFILTNRRDYSTTCIIISCRQRIVFFLVCGTDRARKWSTTSRISWLE